MCACSALAVVNGHHPAWLNCVMNDGALCTGISAAALAKTTSSFVLHAQCLLILKLKFYIHILPLYVVPFDASLLNAKNLRS